MKAAHTRTIPTPTRTSHELVMRKAIGRVGTERFVTCGGTEQLSMHVTHISTHEFAFS